MKAYKCFVLLLVLLLVVSLIAGCDMEQADAKTAKPNQYDWMAGESPISSRRTGLGRQGISTLGFECTASGVYFVLSTNNGKFLFYGDHGSDTIVKLCGRPECNHSDKDCNAYLGFGGTDILYCDGSLYATRTVENKGAHVEVVKFNLDGTGRVSVVDTISLGNHYHGNVCRHLWNGVFTIAMNYIDDTGKEQGEMFYYKLDGSMEQMEPCTMFFPWFNSGEAFINSGTEDGTQVVYSWNPDTNENTYLGKIEQIDASYVTTEWFYKIQDGVVYRYNECVGKEEVLFDTGLDGEKAVICFPDCIVVRDHVSWEDYLEGNTLDKYSLHFYNWDYEFLGSTEVDYPRDKSDAYLICGETPERIILTDSNKLYPRYFIEKSDFGTGSIEIHEYILPDLTEELTKLDQELIGG